MKLALLSLVASVLASIVLAHGNEERPALTGGSDGAGGIPYAGGPHSSSAIKVPHLITLGLVVDSAEAAIPYVPVVVMSSQGTIVAAEVTDDCGLFAVDLPVTAGLTVSLPMSGVNELPIEAGVPILIVVP